MVSYWTAKKSKTCARRTKIELTAEVIPVIALGINETHLPRKTNLRDILSFFASVKWIKLKRALQFRWVHQKQRPRRTSWGQFFYRSGFETMYMHFFAGIKLHFWACYVSFFLWFLCFSTFIPLNDSVGSAKNFHYHRYPETTSSFKQCTKLLLTLETIVGSSA